MSERRSGVEIIETDGTWCVTLGYRVLAVHVDPESAVASARFLSQAITNARGQAPPSRNPDETFVQRSPFDRRRRRHTTGEVADTIASEPGAERNTRIR